MSRAGWGVRGGMRPALRAGGARTLEDAARPELMASDALPEPARVSGRCCRDGKATGGGWGTARPQGGRPPAASAAVGGVRRATHLESLGCSWLQSPPRPRAHAPSRTRVPPWILLLLALLPAKFLGERKRRNTIFREEKYSVSLVC